MSDDPTAKLNAMNKDLINKGLKRAALINEMQAGRKEKNLTASLPRELHYQLVHKYGTEYSQDSVIMNDLKRQYPSMMCMDGDQPPPRWGNATYRKIGNTWYKRQDDGSYTQQEPPSKMNWGSDPPPALIT